MSEQTIKRFLTNKSSIGETRIDEVTAPYSCADGDVVLAIQHGAVTANNITYAAFGDAMQYWNFFPTNLDGWGHMPFWGFADVEQSQIDGMAVGERFYGYFPLASHLIVKPTRISKRGFFDGAIHRQVLVSAYNQYSRCSEDSAYSPEHEHYQSLMRPLFITSYMLADFLADKDFFGAKRLLISSASSKTAYGTAYCLKQDHPGIELVGLTSTGNVGFVESLGCYDAVQSYDDVTKAADLPSSLYVDFSGSNTLRGAIHDHYGQNLVYDCFVGSTANTTFSGSANFSGPRPVFFFAPDQIQKRNDELGGAEVTRRFNAAQNAFIERISNKNSPWISVTEVTGLANAQTLIADIVGGKVDPQSGNVVMIAS